ncbi:hypothetical protein [Haloplanus aerogenes]|uniref:Uncharacterized protein n=1 Tax=Haloplanus aerogenes TaxID=660522 RepID=A0A3M0DGR5_9EURY|nr:hypothetical protein [Haloplanus aerogenes]AZH26389.1 hypothetical protein DU502_13890 [Haloplanus aerogenes]RMB18146.1 hypothetical protein ATH50_1596 [Haloplanus aerogenes]
MPTAESGAGLRRLVEQRRLNAALGWTFVSVLCLIGVAAALNGHPLWSGFTLALVVLAVLPAVASRQLDAMLPWEVLALASVPSLGRLLVAGQTVGGVTLTGRITTYVAVAAAALILAVELDVFTPVRMSDSFAVLFVTIATVAAAGLWAEARWLSDIFLGTSLMLDGRPEHVIETALMWDFVAATVAGVLAGILFELYFRRYANTTPRYPVTSDGKRREGES